MDTPSPLAEVPSPSPATAPPRIAPYWHTALLVLLIAGVSYLSANAASRVTDSSSAVRLTQYFATIIWLWVLLAFTYLGVRLGRTTTMTELIGGKWPTFEDFLLDLAIAAGFWVAAALTLAGLGYVMGLASPEQTAEARRTLQFLAPHSAREYLIWIGLSLSAGICEETIFRGYLQRQFGLIARNAIFGIALSALIFGIGHGYQGGKRMLLIAVYGAMFGILAHWRKSVKPGMFAHAWHDIFSGAVLWLMK